MELENGLPEFCFATQGPTYEVVQIKRGEKGYYRYLDGKLKGVRVAQQLNAEHGISPAQAAAMKSGAIFGWHLAIARADIYDEHGHIRGQD